MLSVFWSWLWLLSSVNHLGLAKFFFSQKYFGLEQELLICCCFLLNGFVDLLKSLIEFVCGVQVFAGLE